MECCEAMQKPSAEEVSLCPNVRMQWFFPSRVLLQTFYLCAIFLPLIAGKRWRRIWSATADSCCWTIVELSWDRVHWNLEAVVKGRFIAVSWYSALMLSQMTMKFTDLVFIVVRVWKYSMPTGEDNISRCLVNANLLLFIIMLCDHRKARQSYSSW